jgi:hypothetical protein
MLTNVASLREGWRIFCDVIISCSFLYEKVKNFPVNIFLLFFRGCHLFL